MVARLLLWHVAGHARFLGGGRTLDRRLLRHRCRRLVPPIIAAIILAAQGYRGLVRGEVARICLPEQRNPLRFATWFDLLAMPVAGVFSLAALAASAFGRRVVWRGIGYELDDRGNVLSVSHARSSLEVPHSLSDYDPLPCESTTFDRCAGGNCQVKTMRVVLWDTRRRDVAKDFAGGFGVGQFRGSERLSGRVIRHFFRRDYRPAALSFAYLAAIFRRLGQRVEYSLDRVPPGADVYVFNPALATLNLERQAMVAALDQTPQPRLLVVGAVARWLPEAFAGLPVTIVDGEAEQLHWKLDEVLAASPGRVSVGQVADLDSLPQPDWEPLNPRSFRIGYDFWRFPTAYIEQSRGCTLKCDYCPYIAGGAGIRFREPAAVVDEMRRGMKVFGFCSFKFRDPLFGVDRRRTLELAERIRRLDRPVQFSIESRIDLLPSETLRFLARAGLTSVTVGIERPDADVLAQSRASADCR